MYPTYLLLKCTIDDRDIKQPDPSTNLLLYSFVIAAPLSPCSADVSEQCVEEIII